MATSGIAPRLGLPGLRETGTVSRRCSKELSRWFSGLTSNIYEERLRELNLPTLLE
jgi:hypothetical protein